MKSLSYLLLFLPFFIFGQKFSAKLNSDFEKGVCECLNNSPEKSINTVGQCIDNWTNKYSSEFSKFIDFNSSVNPQEQFNQIITEFIALNHENMILNCHTIGDIMENLRKKHYESEKKSYQSLHIDELNQNVKNNESSLLTRAKYYFYQNDFDKAEADFNEIIKTNPVNEKAIYFLGIINEFNGNYQKAIELYNQLIKISRNETYLNDIYLVKRKINQSQKN